MADYPWFRIVVGSTLQQGDIFENCPVFLPSPELDPQSADAELIWEKRDLIVISQSCDLVLGQEKVTEALLRGVEPIRFPPEQSSCLGEGFGRCPPR